MTHCGKLQKKINELVDAVNELQESQNTYWTDIAEIKKELQTRAENVQPDVESRPVNVLDKFAEQRRWIGCLVEYGNADDGFRYGILTNIEPIYSAYPFEIDNGREATADCWLPSKTIFYKGE